MDPGWGYYLENNGASQLLIDLLDEHRRLIKCTLRLMRKGSAKNENTMRIKNIRRKNKRGTKRNAETCIASGNDFALNVCGAKKRIIRNTVVRSTLQTLWHLYRWKESLKIKHLLTCEWRCNEKSLIQQKVGKFPMHSLTTRILFGQRGNKLVP